MNHLLRIGALIAAAVVAAACHANAVRTDKIPAVLLVPAGATDVRAETKANGETGVTYTVSEAYPADSLLERIRAVLRSGWTPLQTDWLNPGQPSSHVTGWTTFEDRTRSPIKRVHQWLAQWQDAQGNVVWYALRYESKLPQGTAYPGEPDNQHLRVTAVWEPAALAKQIRGTSAGDGTQR